MEHLIAALEKTISGQSTIEIQQAQKNLKQMSYDVNFTQAIQSLLSNSNYPVNLKKAAAVYLTTHSRATIQAKDQSKMNILCEKLMAMLRNTEIKTVYKIHIAHSIQVMLSYTEKAKVIRSAFIPNLLAILKDINFQNLAQSQVNLQYLAFFGQILMSNPGITDQVSKFIQTTFSPFLKITYFVLVRLQTALSNKDQSETYQNIQLLKLYSYLLKLYLRRFLFVEIAITNLLYSQELQKTLSKGLQLNLPNNGFPSPIFFIIENNSELSKIMNQIKCNFVTTLHSICKVLMNSIKEPSMFNMNATFSQNKNYLPKMIAAAEKFLEMKDSWEKMQDKSAIRTLENVLALFSTMMKNNNCYSIFAQHKSTIIERILMRILTPSAYDLQTYFQNPQEFINGIMHLIERQSMQKGSKQPNSLQQQQNQTQIQEQTLKTTAAIVLGSICKYQDGTISQLFKICILALQGKLNTQFPKSTVIIVLCLLRDSLKVRPDYHLQLFLITTKIFKEKGVPLITDKPEKLSDNMEYCLCLIMLHNYLTHFLMLDSNNSSVADTTFQMVASLLTNQNVQQAPRLIAYNLIEKLNDLSRQSDLIQQNNAPQILVALNKLLIDSNSPSLKLLDCIYSVLRANDLQLLNHLNVVVETLNTLGLIVKREMDSGSSVNKLMVNKCFNAIREVGQNGEYIPAIIPHLQKLLMPLLPYLNNPENDVDYQEDVFILLTAFIQKSKEVTQNQLVMFQYIPKIFYTRYDLTFGHTFNALHIFMFYGKQILSKAPIAMKSILEMCRSSILTVKAKTKTLSEADNCQGVLVLQSLILSCGSVFDQQLWQEIVNILLERLSQPINFHLLKSNLVAALALSLLGGYRFFQKSVNENILQKSLSNLSCFNVSYSFRVYIVALSQLMLLDLQFVNTRLAFIIDACSTLLQLQSSRNAKSRFMIDDVEHDEEKDYKNSLLQVHNSIKNIDEFNYFKTKLQWMRANCTQKINAAILDLPVAKRDFLKHILAIERIMNQPRQILKVKRQS